MSNESETVTIPADLTPEVELIIAVLLEQRPDLEDQLAVVKPTTRDFIGGGVGEIILYIAGGALGWVTKKWVDDILWPELKKRLEKPSQRALKLVFGEAAVSPECPDA